MEAIILAGGFGTRLRHIIPDIPKPMAPVCGRPFLRHIIDDLIDKGIKRIILAVGYKQNVIRDYFGENYKGIKTIYSSEDSPLLTGGAIKKALELCNGNDIFVINGDTYFDVDLNGMYEFKKKVHSPLVIATKEMENFDRYGTILTYNKQIIAFLEKKPVKVGLINGGVYLIDKALFSEIREEKFSFETDILEKKVLEIPMYSFASKGYFIDIGIPEDYYKAQFEFLKIRKFTKNKAVFFDRDGTINVDINYLHKKEDLVFIEGMPNFIKKFNDEGYLVIVVTNQAGIARGYYTEEEMRELHDYMNEQLAKTGAHIDAFYFCPHHPDITGPCLCRKPNPGMIEQAIRDFDIDVSQSFIFGDKPWDIEAGEKCGIKGYIINKNLLLPDM